MNGRVLYTNLKHKNLEKLVLESHQSPVVLVLIADWSGASEIVDAYMEELSVNYHPQIRFYRQDAEKDKRIAQKAGVKKLPATLIFKNGDMVDCFTGVLAKKRIQLKLDAL